jgi:uncharacterized protein (TIGR02186 family)
VRPSAAAAALVLLACPRPAAAETLIVSLSTGEVRISSNFSGTGVTLFGAIERDAATVSRGDAYAVVVVVRGPPETAVTRRKERFLGIWVNRTSETFYGVPAFYAVHTSTRLAETAEPALLERLGIGLEHLPPVRAASPAEAGGFGAALIRLKREAGLYREEIGSVEFPGASIFQTTLRVPANVPVGLYSVTAFLFSGGALLASENARFVISKTGFEQFMFNVAESHAILYGLACIALALAVGWLAGVIFRRD